MYPLTHFLFPLFLAEIFVKFGILNHWTALGAGIFGVLIDIDHIISYVIRHKNLNIRKAWNASVKINEKARTFIHHAAGIVLMTLIIVILFFVNKTAFWIAAIGYYSHMFLDKIDWRRVLKLKRRIIIEKFGFYIRLSFFEIMLDLILILGILLLTLN